MKKKLIVITFAIGFTAALSLLLRFSFTNCKVNNSYSESAESSDLSFAVISDIHDNTANFKNVINDLYDINPKLDVLVMNGDSVDQGLDEQYDDIKDVLQKNSKKLPPNIIKNMGNHEYYNYSNDITTKKGVDNLINKYLDFSGEEKIYHDTWIKGYHFISLGSDNTGVDNINYTSACISDNQVNWLKNTIAENYEKDRPIFVFLHQPIDMNFFNFAFDGVDKNNEIKNILLQYPEVILFGSHTHITPDESIDETKAVTTVNTGSVNSNYVWDENAERGFSEDKSFSDGIYVEVTGNEVVVKARDFKNNSWIYSRTITK